MTCVVNNDFLFLILILTRQVSFIVDTFDLVLQIEKENNYCFICINRLNILISIETFSDGLMASFSRDQLRLQIFRSKHRIKLSKN